MNLASPLNEFRSAKFLEELHHLLWIEPFVNRGQLDHGWNCRDHALVAGCLARMYGLPAAVIHGRSLFVRGPQGKRCAEGLEQQTHTWVGIDGLGFVDLSIRLPKYLWPLACVVGSRCHDWGACEVAETEQHFAIIRNRAIESNASRVAVYWLQAVDELTADLLQNVFDYLNSPLTDELRGSFDDSVYAKAILHLHEILCGTGTTLTAFERLQAWEVINRRPEDGLAKVVEMARLPPGDPTLWKSNPRKMESGEVESKEHE